MTTPGEPGASPLALPAPRVGPVRRTAASRRFAALRSLGRQDQLSEVQRALKDSIEALADNEADIPFALAFILDADQRAHLVAGYGTASPTGPGPAVLNVRDHAWLGTGADKLVVTLDDLPASISFAAGGSEPRALVARIATLAQPDPFAVLILGMDARHERDPDHMTFLELVAERIGRSARLAAEREARFRSVGLLDSLPALISVTRGSRHVYEFVNRAYAEATGLRRSTLGKTFEQAHPNDQIQGLSPARDRALAGETVVLKETALSPGAGADTNYYDLVYQPLYGPAGEVDGVMSFAIDVSEQVRARKSAERLAAELEEATRFKDELLALVSHELRTPLTIALGTLDFLNRGLETLPADEVRDLLDDALQNGRRLERLVSNMLTLSRVELIGAGEVEPMLLHRTLPGTIATIARDLRFDPSRIDLQLRETRPALANAVFLDQILANLISNGFKYGEPGSPVTVKLADAPDAVVITVESVGSGMAQPDIDAIFDPFFRAGGAENRASGLGLGLAVCRRLATAQGGSVAAQAREGGGLCISLSLQAAEMGEE